MTPVRERITRVSVATASLLAIITLGIPWADEYFAHRQDLAEFTELQAELNEVQLRSKRLEVIAENLSNTLEELTDRSVVPETVTLVREDMIEIVRRRGGRLRSLDISNGLVRPWALENDNATEDAMPDFAVESDYDLHQQEVDLQADGTLDSIVGIVRDIVDRGWFVRTRMMQVMPTGKAEAPISIEWRMILYGMEKRPEENDDFASQVTPKDRRLAMR